ncbi:MAG TPA: DUF177 domain-containing protein [Leeuwenhoekiella sp.]|nr:DUF177 domain-containing protein [Leeuwenhoekiella sp.]
MNNLKAFTIQFVGLKQGEHDLDYKIDNTFFKNYEYDDFNAVDLIVNVKLIKKSTLLEFIFHAHGSVNVNCDLTNEPYDHPLDATYKLVVKFGQEYNDDLEDIVIIPHGEFEFNIAQYIYELIVLTMPAKRVHPGVEDGTLQSDMLDKLEELSIRKEKPAEENEDSTIDPRWEKLKDFLTDK